MDMSKVYKIALVIKTEGLQYDDRVRKEIVTVQRLFPNVTFQIFAMLPENKEYDGVTDYGIPYKSLYLSSRDKYPSARKLLLKSYDFYRVVSKHLADYDAIWCADRHCFMVPALINHKRILWDLHELPYEFIGNKIKETFLKFILRRCRVVVHANPQRLSYMASLSLISDKSKHYSIRNYPNFDDVDHDYDEDYYKFVSWKNERMCVYLQGLNNDGRAAYESVEAVLHIKNLVAVVVGYFDPTSKEKLREKWGEQLSQRIFFAGKIPQMKIPQYVSQCITTMVFYKNIRMNNFYCEANRFYQSVILGLPVIVGNNPPMKELVEKYGFGVSIDDDGRNIKKIENALAYVVDHLEEFTQNIYTYRDKLTWNTQDEVFVDMINKLFE